MPRTRSAASKHKLEDDSDAESVENVATDDSVFKVPMVPKRGRPNPTAAHSSRTNDVLCPPDLDVLIIQELPPKRGMKSSPTVYDEIPPIRPIQIMPFDDEIEIDSSASPTAPKSSGKKGNHNIGTRLDLPIVFNNLKVENFTNRSKIMILGSKTPRNKTRMSITSGGLKIGRNLVSEGSIRPVTLKDDLHTRNLDRLNRNMQKKVIDYMNKKSVEVTANGESALLRRPIDAQKKAHIRSFTGKSPRDDPESYPWRMLARTMSWANNIHMAWPAINEIAEKWSYAREQARSETRTPMSPTEVAAILETTADKLTSFDFYDNNNLFHYLRNKGYDSFAPDIIKQLALSSWQKGDWETCTYFLTESHATYLRHEISDRHFTYLCRTEEFASTMKLNPDQERLKAEVFKMQIADLNKFGQTKEAFKRNIERINPDWNVVQLTSLFHVNNRYGTALSSQRKTPALFLSSFTTIDSTVARNSFTTYVAPPSLDPGLTKTDLLEHFMHIMSKNRSINEGFDGDRTKYWASRKEHNEHLMTVMGYMEESWISPWTFLFPGNIKDATVVNKINDLLVEIEAVFKKKIPKRIKGVLYKLIENFSCLQLDAKQEVSYLLAQIMDLPMNKTLLRICARIAEVGSTISFHADRHPTILVLDQDIEQMPWDWLPCLKSTDVTRVPSVSMIYSLMKIDSQNTADIDVDQCTFVLNPDGTLKSVQERLKDYLFSRAGWKGFVGQKPTVEEADTALQDHDLMVFCGHGSGNSIFSELTLFKVICRAVPMLMGCGSVRVISNGPKSYPSSSINSYLIAACRSVVGFLWEVTDVECDRVTVDILERFAPGDGNLPKMAGFDSKLVRPQERELAACVRLCRAAATQFMTEAGVVNYGIPLRTKDAPRKQK